jgi:hypothetical protein
LGTHRHAFVRFVTGRERWIAAGDSTLTPFEVGQKMTIATWHEIAIITSSEREDSREIKPISITRPPATPVTEPMNLGTSKG